jgi:hypothetical protein
VALLARSDQLAAEDREQGGVTVWGRDATAAGSARGPRGDGLGCAASARNVDGAAEGLADLHLRLADRAGGGIEVPRR